MFRILSKLVILPLAILVSCSGKQSFGGVSKAKIAPKSIIEKKQGDKGNDSATGAGLPNNIVPIVATKIEPPKLLSNERIALVQNKFYLKESQQVTIEWSLTEDIPDLDVFVFSVVSKDQQFVFSKEIKPESVQKGATHKFTIDFPLEPNVFYVFGVSAYLKDRSYLSPTEGLILLDSLSPNGKLYLGSQGSPNPCTNPPLPSTTVATRIIPVQACLNDQDGAGSGVEKFCLIQSSAGSGYTEIPVGADACWKAALNFPTEVSLSSEEGGSNFFHLFVKDKVGNAAKLPVETIKIIPSVPPKISIIEPSSSQLAQATWMPGEQKVFKFRVEDTDTNAQDIRLIVSLLNKKDKTDFIHLACNFADLEGAALKLCPNDNIANAADMSMDSTGEVRFRFTVSNTWDLNKEYVLAVTAIDRGGNAAVVSTSEINQPWEVIAGRSYNGFGGSGTTLVTSEPGSIIATDKLGQLYNTSAHKEGNVKIRALDGRSCRMTKPVAGKASAFDCADILETNETILGRKWIYNELKDVFVTVIGEHIFEINFVTGKVTRITGGGTATLPSGNQKVAIASLAKIPGLRSRVSFNAAQNATYFLASGKIYKVDKDGMVQFYLGAGSSAYPTAAVTQAAPAQLVLPPIAYDVFEVTNDGRVVFSSVPPANWIQGSQYGMMFVVEFVKINPNEDAVARLTVLGGDADLTTADRYTPVKPLVSSYFSDSVFDSKENVFYVELAWVGIYKITIPAAGSSRTAYVPQLVYQAKVAANFAKAPNAELFYMNESASGIIYEISRNGNQQLVAQPAAGQPLRSLPPPVNGTPVPDTPLQSENVTLDAPRYFDFVGNESLVFVDIASGRLSSADKPMTSWNVTVLQNSGPFGAVQVGSNRIIRGSLGVVDNSSLLAPMDAGQKVQMSFSQCGWYPLQFAFSNTNTSGKFYSMGNCWDGQNIDGGASIFVSTFAPDVSLSGTPPALSWPTFSSSSNIANVNTISTLNPQAPQLTENQSGGRGGQYFAPATYRLSADGFWTTNRSQQTIPSFTAQDKVVLSCGSGDSFIALEASSNKIFPFSATYTENAVVKKLTCPFYGVSFFSFADREYMFNGGSFYRLAANSLVESTSVSGTIFSSNTATYEKMNFGSMPTGFVPGQIRLRQAGSKVYLYATDIGNDRLFRKEVNLQN